MKELSKTDVKGGGGTTISPAIYYANEHYPGINMLILGDGYSDSLDFSKTKGNVLLVSAGVKMPIAHSNGKIKQILVDNSYS